MKANMNKIKKWGDKNPEYAIILSNDLFKPLKDLGFTLISIDTTWDFLGINAGAGTHSFIFELDTNSPHRIEDLIDEVAKLMWEDDGQPKTTFSYYFGTLWVYNPIIL